MGVFFFSFVALKEPRHTIFILFPLVFLSVLSIHLAAGRNWIRYGLLSLSILNFIGVLVLQPIPFVRNYDQAADYVAAHLPKGYRVMIHSYWDGNFIFNLWCHRERRDLAILRSDKFLLEMAVKRSMGVDERPWSEEDIVRMLNDYGVYYVVCQHGFWDDLSVMRRFERVMKDRFENVHQVDIETNFSNRDIDLIIYRNPKIGNGPFQSIEYALPIIGAKIENGKIETQ